MIVFHLQMHLREMTTSFTIAALRKLKPRESPFEVRSSNPKGLLLRVQPSGVKTFYFEHTRGKREKLGKNGNLMLENQTITQIKRLAMITAAEGPKESRLDKKKTTLDGFLKGDYADYISDRVITHRQHIRCVERNYNNLLNRRMDQIQPMDIERWKKKRLKQGVKFETIKRDFACLKACLNTAISPFRYIMSHELMSYRLEAPTQVTEGSEKKVRFLSAEEEQRLRLALSDREDRIRQGRSRGNEYRLDRGYAQLPDIPPYADHIKPLVLLALNTGLRRGDLFALEWQHIDLGREEINKVIRKTRRKRGKSTMLPLSIESIEILATWREQVSGVLVFPSPVTGGKLDNIDSAWKALLKSADIENFRFHDLRHTFATRLIEAGVAIYTVKELMTHSSIAQTEIYAHVSGDLKKEAINLTFRKGQA